METMVDETVAANAVDADSLRNNASASSSRGCGVEALKRRLHSAVDDLTDAVFITKRSAKREMARLKRVYEASLGRMRN